MPTDIPPLAYGTFYHIYNRGDNHENIFFQERRVTNVEVIKEYVTLSEAKCLPGI
jgi:hypothetical protein